MIKTAEQLREQALAKGITSWNVHNCSMCGYPCGYLINGDSVSYDSGCACVTWHNIQPRDWADLAYSYNLNQPENNPKIKQEYLVRLNETWQFDDALTDLLATPPAIDTLKPSDAPPNPTPERGNK